MLKMIDGSIYTGITNNLYKRLILHERGKGSKYVRSRLPFSIIYVEETIDKNSAQKRELEIKKYSANKKIKLSKNKSNKELVNRGIPKRFLDFK